MSRNEWWLLVLRTLFARPPSMFECLLRISVNVTDRFRNIVTGTFGEAKADKSYTNRSRTGARSALFLFLNHAVSFLRSDSLLSSSL